MFIIDPKLATILKHAFLSGVVAARNTPAHEGIDGPALWTEYEPYSLQELEEISEAMNNKITNKDFDCDFYYFKQSGKWAYEGQGFFDCDGAGVVTHDVIYQRNQGMPGIISDGKDYNLVVVPREHCTHRFAYPRFVKSTA